MTICKNAKLNHNFSKPNSFYQMQSKGYVWKRLQNILKGILRVDGLIIVSQKF